MPDIDPQQLETPEPSAHPVAEPVSAEGTYAAPVAPPPPPRKSRTAAFFFGALSGCLFVTLGVFLLAMLFAAGRSGGGDLSLSRNKIAVLPIEGEIVESRETIEALHKYAENDSIKAIVIRINSPGGAIAPSQEIYSEIRKIDKPVIASMDSVAASGGYYIAAACDQIVANPGTITGSIGVIMQWLEYEELVKWAKMRPETITSGELKGAGSPFKKLSDVERQYLQRIVLQLHSQFVKAVVEGRQGRMNAAEVGGVSDGRVFTGEEALSLKLVDRLGNLDDAVAMAADLAGVKGEPDIIYPRRRNRTLFDLLADDGQSKSLLDQIIKGRAARFLYMWEAAQAQGQQQVK